MSCIGIHVWRIYCGTTTKKPTGLRDGNGREIVTRLQKTAAGNCNGIPLCWQKKTTNKRINNGTRQYHKKIKEKNLSVDKWK